MKFLNSILIGFILFPVNPKAQNITFFLDSPSDEYYDYSWMEVTSPSELFRKGNELRKFPVETSMKFQGSNCLFLKWNSSEGGDWAAIAATDGWGQVNLTDKDYLSFYLSSSFPVEPVNLPGIFMEDIENNKTTRITLSVFVADTIKPGEWTHVMIPLDTLFNAPQPIDFTKVKTVGFAQNQVDEVEHTLYIDNIKAIATADSGAISIPQGLSAKGYDRHIYLSWDNNPENYCDGYIIYCSANGGNFVFRTYIPYGDSVFTDFTGKLGNNLELQYRMTAVDNFGNKSDSTEIISVSTYDMDDEELLTMVQEATFRYYWDFAHPVSGMSREASDQGLNICTTGGTGFGIMAILVGIEREFITRLQGLQRINKIVDFLEASDRFHGAWPHWINGNTGNVVPFSTKDDGGDLVETAFLIEGLLTARQYFNTNDSLELVLNQKITTLWEDVEWDWYTNNSNTLYWHWSPNYGWEMNMQIRGYNEALVVYILAIASTTHPVSENLYHTGWASSNYYNGKTFYGHLLAVGPDDSGPLFWTHYSFLGFDPRFKRDSYTNYFLNNVNWASIHRDYAIANPRSFEGYGSDCWGLTASYDPITGYLAHEPDNDNGTISPTAAVASIPYTPEFSLEAIKHFYRELGDKIWGNMGFTDAFNLTEKWYSRGYISIDQGPIINMIENYRTGLLWDNFMANPEIQPALTKIGFVPDSSQSLGYNSSKIESGNYLTVFPNPAQSSINIELFSPCVQEISVSLFDASGKEIKSIVNKQRFNHGRNSLHFPLDEFLPGMYFVQVKTEKKTNYERFVIYK